MKHWSNSGLANPLQARTGSYPPLFKLITDSALNAEIDEHIKESDTLNRKNGKTRKTVKSASGSFELETPAR
jgi:transposase-like protein